MRRVMRRRLDRLRAHIPEGCRVCRTWPRVWIINDTGTEPPDECNHCGRLFSGLVRVYVGVDVDAI